ncbi:Flp pilus assembly protein CpaB [Phenylobacterium sp.]|jgi:pilus assembly protein CpaB|uniref:Flp pilus assembly protein CpaB n=1 Tax=Phenylobacterium sp. TaxID=1871053 RepID=UPI002F957E05
MRRVGLVLLALSLLLGGVAVWSLRSFSGANAAPAPAPQAGPRTTVVVAARPIAFGEQIGPGVLKEQPWPGDATPPGAFRSIGELTSGQPRLALSPLAANEPILAPKISGPGGRATLSGVIRAGYRASTIRVDDATGVAGFVLPGDFVDVIVTRPEKQGAEGEEVMRSDTLLEGVRVLAVDQVSSDRKNEPVVAKAATVEVTPDQAQKLALAGQVGTLALALRGSADPLASAGPAAARTMRTGDLRLAGAGVSEAPARVRVVRVARNAGPSGPTLKIYRAADATSVRVARE